jgi:hypothetical protein
MARPLPAMVFLVMMLLSLLPVPLCAQEIQGQISSVPSEYRKIWETQEKYDVVLYKLLQLGSGIEPGDRFIIPVEADLYEFPPIEDIEGIMIAVFYTLYSQDSRALFGRDAGLIVALFADLPEGTIDRDTVKGYLLGEYLGHCTALNAPLIKTDYILLEDAGSSFACNDYGDVVLDEAVLEAVEAALIRGD